MTLDLEGTDRVEGATVPRGRVARCRMGSAAGQPASPGRAALECRADAPYRSASGCRTGPRQLP